MAKRKYTKQSKVLEKMEKTDLLPEEEIKEEKIETKEIPIDTERVMFDIEGKFIHVKVGNNKWPATNEDINNTQELITELLERNKINCVVFVTHHAIEIKVVGDDSKDVEYRKGVSYDGKNRNQKSNIQ